MRIATKTALSFAAFAVACVGGSGLLLIDESHEALLEGLRDKQQLLVSERALVLRHDLELAASELERLAATERIDLEDDDPQPERRLLAQAYRQTSFFNERLELYGAQGRCRWAEPRSRGCPTQDAANEPWFRLAMRSWRATLLYQSEPDGRGRIVLAAPVRRDGRAQGVLRGVVDLQGDRTFSPALRDGLRPSTAMALVTSDGRALMKSAEVSLTNPPWTTALERLAPQEPGAARSGTALVEGRTRTHLVAWSPVGRGGSTLIFAWPIDALDEAAQRHVRSFVLSILVVGALALAIGFVVASRLTRPLHRLAQQVRGVRARTFRKLPPTARTDEIGQVQRAYAALLEELEDREAEIRDDRDRISELASGLEDRVEERTRELRDAQGALVQAERMAAIGRAATVLSHELRNTLNAVSVAMDTLGSEETEESMRVARRMVRGEIARLRKLSDDLLSYAREPVLDRTPTSMTELLEVAGLLVEDHAREHEVEMQIVVDDGPRARVDPDRVQTVLVNLMRNAVEAAAEGEERLVRVTARTDGDEVRIGVEDSGHGVSDAVRDRLFQPFVTSRRQGLGLGLAIAERFVRAHGGSIGFDDSPLGGARFAVRLPAGRGAV